MTTTAPSGSGGYREKFPKCHTDTRHLSRAPTDFPVTGPPRIGLRNDGC